MHANRNTEERREGRERERGKQSGQMKYVTKNEERKRGDGVRETSRQR